MATLDTGSNFCSTRHIQLQRFIELALKRVDLAVAEPQSTHHKLLPRHDALRTTARQRQSAKTLKTTRNIENKH
jgi:hypothetical protein